MRKLWYVGLLVLLLTSACGGSDSQATATFIPSPVAGTATLPSPIVGSATGTPRPSPTGPAATAARPTPSAPGALTITASDGDKLAAVYYPPVIVNAVAGEKAPACGQVGHSRGQDLSVRADDRQPIRTLLRHLPLEPALLHVVEPRDQR
ncbi:MAG: hypothetical protein ABI847_13915, partial [Anaerolineales bacterium]